MVKRIFQTVILFVLVLASLSSAGSAKAWTGCGSAHYVQWGDTLSGIAVKCGTTMWAIRQVNPGLYNWVYAGQVLVMPGGQWQQPGNPPPYTGGSTYVIQWGDTLRILATRWGVTVYDIMVANPQIAYASLIYAGQVINIPGTVAPPPPPPPVYNPSYYTVQYGDTLRIIANRFGTTVYNLQLLNPQIWNPNLIFAGTVLRVQ